MPIFWCLELQWLNFTHSNKFIVLEIISAKLIKHWTWQIECFKLFRFQIGVQLPLGYIQIRMRTVDVEVWLSRKSFLIVRWLKSKCRFRISKIVVCHSIENIWANLITYQNYVNTVKWNRRLVCSWSKMSTFQTNFLPPKNVGPLRCSIPCVRAFKWDTVWHSTSRGIRTTRILS